MDIKIMPVIALISPRIMQNSSIMDVSKTIIPSRLISSLLVLITQDMLAAMPIMPAIFHILDPITTPTPRSGFPVKTEIIADPNSGSEVPAAATVMPNIIGIFLKNDLFQLNFQQIHLLL